MAFSEPTSDPYFSFTEGVECPEPEPLPGGKLIGSRYEAGDTVTFVCFPGLQLVGNSKNVCQRDGSWSSSFPECYREY